MTVQKISTKRINDLNILSDRLEKLKREYYQAPRVIVCQRARSITDSWKETEADPNRIRWGKAFARVLEESPIIIRDGELIVGSETKHIRGAEVVPEVSPYDVLSSLEQRTIRTMSEVMGASMDGDEEDFRTLANFWVGRSVNDIVHRAWQREMGDAYKDLIGGRDGKVYVLPDVNGTVYKTQTIFNAHVLQHGLKNIKAQALEEKEKAKGAKGESAAFFPAIYHKMVIADVIIMVCDAMVRYANKHAALAARMAQQESNPQRKKELKRIAECCEWVPENPPRNFQEALQFYWFIHLGLRKEAPYHSGPCPARMDQWLYPYYEKDLREGRITQQEAGELIALLWVKLNEMQNISGSYFEKEAAGSLLQQVTLGGQTIDGNDATNELSFLILEAAKQVQMPQPGIYIRWHSNLDHEFMVKAIETNVALRGGIPAFLNDRIAVRNFLTSGVAYEDAMDWSAAGCLSYVIGHCNLASKITAQLVIPKVLEIALNNGIDPKTGNKVGKETGDPSKFTSIEQVYDAFWTQYDYFVDRAVRDYWVGYAAKIEHLGTPLTSIMIEDCLKRGLDVYEGGERYPQLGVNFGQRGFVDVADALAAIKKLVFDEKKITMARLLEALEKNWEGCEEIRQMCLQAPKYGNDDDYADEIFNYISLKANEIVFGKPNPCTGQKWRVSRPALTGHYPAGEVTGALPNGRKAGTPLYDAGLSPMVGADVEGPTALINSATKANHCMPEMDSIVLNMKVSPSVMQSRKSIDNVIAMLKTFYNRGGWHIQFNITSKEDLIDAKQHPEKWQQLIVRVAGYSAYFVDLPPAVQQEITDRTEHSLQ